MTLREPVGVRCRTIKGMTVISSRKPTSIFSIGSDNFEREVIEESRPVLLLCMYQEDSDYQKQIEIVQTLHNAYGEKLSMYVLEEGFIEVFMERYSIKGTPTFLVFIGGREKGRMLGQADLETLRNFVSQTLLSN